MRRETSFAVSDARESRITDMKPYRTSRGQGGFSLLEVLVAFSILALSLAVLMQIFSGAMRNAALSEQYSHATLLAQSILSSAGIEEPLQEGGSAGQGENGMSWRLSISTYEEPVEEGGEQPRGLGTDRLEAIEGYRVRVEVSWEDGGQHRQVELESLRIAAPER